MSAPMPVPRRTVVAPALSILVLAGALNPAAAESVVAGSLQTPPPRTAPPADTVGPPFVPAALPQDTSGPPSVPPDPAALTAFFDGMIQTHLREREIAGATLSVVQGGEVVAARGYGYAHVGQGRRVDPEETLFRIGSVSKLFTFTAAMQLVEEGRLDLDTDINEYLDFPIPATYPEPITVAHLMTHTGGFEEDLRNLFIYHPDGIVPLGDWIRDNYPGRVRAPGTFSSYSNYGVAVLGRIVERVSGLEWHDYLESRILEPLAMTRTTGRQPLPERLAPDMSEGYVPSNGGFRAQEFEITMGADPAGSMTSTATDMARFMLAILGEGRLGDARILEEESVHTMTARHFEHDPRIPGYGLGFYEMNSHGQRIVGHAGNTGWFHALLALFPEYDLGFFVSYNTSTAAAVSFAPVLHTFLDWRFPSPPPEREPVSAGDLTPLVGTYRFNRVPYTNFQKAGTLVTAVPVREEDGLLVVRTPFGIMRMVQVAPLLFQEERGSTLVALRTDDTGRATHAFPSLTPMMALERMPWHASPRLHLPILGGGLVVFLGILVGAVVGGLRRRRRYLDEPGALRLGRWGLVGAAATNVGFLVVVAALLAALDLWGFLTTPMTGFAVALALPVLGAAAVLLSAVAMGVLWSRGLESPWLRIRYSAGVLVALLFSWSLYYWNLLGWRF